MAIQRSQIQDEIDVFRGHRNYLRASDVLSIAPLWTNPRSFDFRFYKPACHPGHWKTGRDAHLLGPFDLPVASLRLYLPHNFEDWIFVVDTSREVKTRLDDLDEERLCAELRIEAGRSDLVLSNEFSIWDYLVASARRFFPPANWYFAYLNARYENFPTMIEGKHLHLAVAKKRSRLAEFEIFIDDRFGGVFGAYRKD